MSTQFVGPSHWEQLIFLQAWKTQRYHHPNLWPSALEARMLTCKEQVKMAEAALSPAPHREFLGLSRCNQSPRRQRMRQATGCECPHELPTKRFAT